MVLTQSEAAAALQDIDDAREQSRQMFVYQMASPYLLLWGAIWLVGGLAPLPLPANPSIAWMVLDAVGIAGSIWIGFTNKRRYSGNTAARSWAWRYAASFTTVFVFAILTVVVFEAHSAAQGMTFAAILTGAIFTAVGVWVGARYVVTGIVLAAVAVAAHFLKVPYEVPVICFAGGATMMLGGLWMRRA